MVNLQSAIDQLSIDNPSLANILYVVNSEMTALKKDIQRKDKDIVYLTNCIEDLSERVLQLERYSRKDCLIFNNFPYDPISNKTLQDQVIDFINDIFNSNIPQENLKACHFLKSGVEGQCSVIVKFVYFADKNFLWRSQSFLYGVKNRRNQQFISMKECFPEKDREILKYAVTDKHLKVSTNNCAVKVEVTINEGRREFVEVRTENDVDRFENVATKRRTRKQVNSVPSQPMEVNAFGNPNVQSNSFTASSLQLPPLTYNPIANYHQPIIGSKRAREPTPAEDRYEQLLQDLREKVSDPETLKDFVLGMVGNSPNPKSCAVDNEHISSNDTFRAEIC